MLLLLLLGAALDDVPEFFRDMEKRSNKKAKSCISRGLGCSTFKTSREWNATGAAMVRSSELVHERLLCILLLVGSISLGQGMYYLNSVFITEGWLLDLHLASVGRGLHPIAMDRLTRNEGS